MATGREKPVPVIQRSVLEAGARKKEASAQKQERPEAAADRKVSPAGGSFSGTACPSVSSSGRKPFLRQPGVEKRKKSLLRNGSSVSLSNAETGTRERGSRPDRTVSPSVRTMGGSGLWFPAARELARGHMPTSRCASWKPRAMDTRYSGPSASRVRDQGRRRAYLQPMKQHRANQMLLA